MKLIIEIDEGNYNKIKTFPVGTHDYKITCALYGAVKNGIFYNNSADILFICDHSSCNNGITNGANACDPCEHTRNIEHAANFEPIIDNDGRVVAYFEKTDKEGGADRVEE